MSTMILYHGEPNGASLAVLAALYESGADAETRSINVLAGERHSLAGISEPLALDMGVEGEGPVLLVDGEAMTESVFIAQFLDECGTGALQPKDAYRHWEMLMWCRRVTERGSPAAAFLGCQAEAHASLAAVDDAAFGAITAKIASDDLRARWHQVRDGDFPEDMAADSRTKIVDAADNIEAKLADGRDWLMGDFSIADLVSFSWLTGMELRVPEAFSGKPNLSNWLARMRARPSIARALSLATIADPGLSWVPGPEINRWG